MHGSFDAWPGGISGGFGHAAGILDIPAQRLHDLRSALVKQGWCQTYEYDNFDAWIDYGKVILKKDGVTLIMEWDKWLEGSVEGPRTVIAHIAEQYGFAVTDAWRGEV